MIDWRHCCLIYYCKIREMDIQKNDFWTFNLSFQDFPLECDDSYRGGVRFKYWRCKKPFVNSKLERKIGMSMTIRSKSQNWRYNLHPCTALTPPLNSYEFKTTLEPNKLGKFSFSSHQLYCIVEGSCKRESGLNVVSFIDQTQLL